MRTASSIDQMFKSKRSDKLVDVPKIDIQWAERDAIPPISQSRFLAEKVKQFAVEVHFGGGDRLQSYRSQIEILQKS